MARYRISTELTISVATIVEADDEESAKAESLLRNVTRLCHTCTGDVVEEWATSGELDGEPDVEKMQVEKLDD